MLRALPLCLLLAACGDPAPAVVSDTDVTVAEAPAAAPAADGAVTDAPADDSAPEGAPVSEAAPAADPAPAPPPPPPAPAEAAPAIPPGLASLPGDALWGIEGTDETVMFQTGSSPTTGESIWTPHPDIDPIYGTWTIRGNTITFDAGTFTFVSSDESGYTLDGPDGRVKLVLLAG